MCVYLIQTHVPVSVRVQKSLKKKKTCLFPSKLQGRKGLGSIFVWATGNGGLYGDDCSADGYVSRPETLSVGSVNDWGRSPFFMENCSSTLAVVPSGGEDYRGQEEEMGEIKLKVVSF